MPRPNNDRPIVDAAKVTASAVILTPVALIGVLIVLALIGWAASSPAAMIVFGVATLVWWTKRKESDAAMAQLRAQEAQPPVPLTPAQEARRQELIEQERARRAKQLAESVRASIEESERGCTPEMRAYLARLRGEQEPQSRS